MKAIVIQAQGEAAVQDVPVPKMKSDYVKVKNVAVALNPTDWKHIDYMPSPGSVVGCDFSGIVEEVGEDVETDVKPGDRIAGATHGSNHSDHQSGCFGEYCLAKDGAFLKVPPSMSMEEASTLGVGITTVAIALYSSLNLPWPTTPAKTPFPILIYGGSTATGTIAIQYAKLSGLQVLTTASRKHFPFLESLGAAVFDYSAPDCGAQIRAHTANQLHHAFDCISTDATSAICAAALSTDAAAKNYYTNLSISAESSAVNVVADSVLAYTATGEEFEVMGRTFPAIPEHYALAKRFWALAGRLVAEGRLKTHPREVRGGGLAGVLEGLDDLRKGRVSGVKLVYPLDGKV